MAGQIGNNPLDRIQQQPQTQPVDGTQAKDVKRVGTGFGVTDTSSLNEQGKLPVALQPKQLKLAAPAQEVLREVKAQHIDQQSAQGQISRIHTDLAFAMAAVGEGPLAENGPVVERLDKLASITLGLEGGDSAALKAIGSSVAEIKNLAQAGTLTEDKLQELMSELNARLQDNSVKFNEETIKSAQDARQQAHEKTLAKYEKLAERRSVFDLSHLSPGEKAGAILGFIFAPAIIPATLAIVEAARGPIGPRNIDLLQRSSNPGALAAKLGLELPGKPASKNERAAKAYEGFEVSRTGLSHNKMMKLLAQQQQAEEQKEKLEKTTLAMQEIQAGNVQQASDLMGQDLGSEVDPLSGEQLSSTQVAEGRTEFFGTVEKVAGATATAQKEATDTQAQIQRFNRA
ncbi:hypothetical protein [Spongorhabdus nitratireducens]